MGQAIHWLTCECLNGKSGGQTDGLLDVIPLRVVILNPRNLNLFKSTSLHRTEEWLARGTRGRLEGNGPTGHHSDTALH